MSRSVRGTWTGSLFVLIAAYLANSSQPALGINLPAAGMNASGYAYFTTALPFVDVAHMGDQWHPVSTNWTNPADLPAIPLTSENYPASLAPGEIARSLIYTGNGSKYPTGTYTLRWSGNGTAQLTAPNLTVISSQPGLITYKLSATNPNGLMLDITKTDPANPVRNVVVQAPFAGVNGSAFTAGYKSDLANYGVVRYMGWNMTNSSKVSSWSDRTAASDMFWGGATGVPYEYQIQLSNETKEDLWITVPHMADDNYVRNLANMVKQKLSPGLRVWVEYSNEVWNGGFTQFQYAYNVLQPKYGVANSEVAYGRRSAEIFDIFSSQINDSKRLVRVVAGQNANSWVLDQALTGATVNGTLKADVAAVAPYFTADVDKLYQQYLTGQVNLDNVFSELHSAVDSVMKSAGKNEQVAAARGIPLVAYEGGQHLIAKPGEQHNNQGFVDLLSNINRDPRMGDLYKYMLDQWYEEGGKTFVFAGETMTSTKWGSWGLKENYLDNDAVKFRAVQDYLKALPHNPADFNKDGAVDQSDYKIWRSTLGSRTILSADANGNGIVDAADFIVWSEAMARAAQASIGLATLSPIPEPVALFLLAQGACIYLCGNKYISVGRSRRVARRH